MANSKISVENLNLHYGENHALKDVNMEIADHAITAFIGPSGCGKSTFLRCLNRMNDLVDGCRVEGKAILDGEDIYDKRVDTTLLRKKVGMVFQQPNPFPMSIYDNIAYGPRLHGIKNKKELLLISNPRDFHYIHSMKCRIILELLAILFFTGCYNREQISRPINVCRSNGL